MAGHPDLEAVYAVWPELSKECNIPQGGSMIGISMKGHDLRMNTKLLRLHARFDSTGVTILGVIRLTYDRS